MREMTDWGLDELGSIAWDEFGNNDDHIVPPPVTEQGNGYVTPGDIHTKLCYLENVGNSMDGRGSASKTSFRGKEKTHFCLPVKDEKSTMMEDSKSRASEDAVPASCDPKLVTSVSAFASPVAGFSDKCFIMCSLDTNRNLFCSENPISGSELSTEGTGSCNLSCDDVPPSAIDSLEEENKRKESDLVYYDLPDIGNFDEIDQVFRNCDVTFGQGVTGTADELSWFSSSNTIYSSEVSFESGLQSSCSEFRTLNSTSAHWGADTNFLTKNKKPMADHNKPSGLCYQSCTDWSDANVEKDQSNYGPKVQVEDGVHGVNMSTLTEINSSNDLVGHSDPDMVIMNLKKMENQSSPGENGIEQSGDQKLLSFAVCTQAGPLQTSSKKKQMDNLTHHDLLQQRTSIKLETAPSYKISDNIMHHGPQCIEILPDQIGEPSNARTEKFERLYHSNQVAIMTAENMHQPASFMRRCHNYPQEIGPNGKVDNINLEPTVEIDSLVIQERSCMMSLCADDISPEATSFQQLHDVMVQLDVTTKLCIRDSLYRLARNVKERNGFTAIKTCNSTSNTARGIKYTEASKGCAELLDAETVTNPIDRSMAHLLFTGLQEPTLLA